MTDFFEKLKKGMDTKNVPEMPRASEELTEPVEPVEPVEPNQPEEPETEPGLVVASIEDEVEEEPEVKPKKKKRKITKKSKKEKKPAFAKSSGEAKPAKKKIEIKMEKPVVDDEPEKINIDEEEKDLFIDEFGQLTVDLYQTDKEVVIQSAIAGVEPEDLDINIEDDLLIIKGKREKKFAQEEKNYFYQECYWGQFSREIILPVEVDSSRAEASMDQGVLTIRIPKIGTETKKKIIIKT